MGDQLGLFDVSFAGEREIGLGRHDACEIDDKSSGIWYGAVVEQKGVEMVCRRLTREIM